MELRSRIQAAASRAKQVLTPSGTVQRGPKMHRLIVKRWPQLEHRLPEDLEYYSTNRFTGLTSDVRFVDHNRALYPVFGAKPFLLDHLPDPFFVCLIHNRGNFERVLLEWRQGKRRLWFNQTFVISVGDDSLSALQRVVSERLDEALARWDRGDDVVIFEERLG